MKKESLFDLFQNVSVSAIAFHGFTYGYHNVAKNNDELVAKYPHINFLFFVLPVVYNKTAMNVFSSSNALYSVLQKESSIILGLQDRANKMSIQTFDGLNLAFNKLVLTINKENNTIEILKGFQTKKLPLTLSQNNLDNSVKKIQDCSVKLGGIFAKRSIENLEFELNIKL